MNPQLDLTLVKAFRESALRSVREIIDAVEVVPDVSLPHIRKISATIKSSAYVQMYAAVEGVIDLCSEAVSEALFLQEFDEAEKGYYICYPFVALSEPGRIIDNSLEFVKTTDDIFKPAQWIDKQARDRIRESGSKVYTLSQLYSKNNKSEMRLPRPHFSGFYSKDVLLSFAYFWDIDQIEGVDKGDEDTRCPLISFIDGEFGSRYSEIRRLRNRVSHGEAAARMIGRDLNIEQMKKDYDWVDIFLKRWLKAIEERYSQRGAFFCL